MATTQEVLADQIQAVADVYATQAKTLITPVANVRGYGNGATGDGMTDDTDAIQAALADPSVNTVVIPEPISYYKVSQPLTISQPKTIVFVGGRKTEICQTQFEYPVFYVTSPGVSFIGQVKLRNLGTPYHIQQRVDGVPEEYAGSPNVFSAGITTSGKVDNLFIDHVEAYNFACGISFANSVTSDETYSENVHINYLYAEDCWCGLMGGGFINMHTDTVVGKNMVSSQGSNPAHVVYLGQRDLAPDHYVSIGMVIGRDCMGDSVLQAKTVQTLNVGRIITENCRAAASFYKIDTGFVGEISGDLIDALEGSNQVYVFSASSIRVDRISLKTAMTHKAAQVGASVINVTSGATLDVASLDLLLTDLAAPARAARSSSAVLKLHQVSLTYASVPTINPIKVEEGEVYLYHSPVVKGTDGKLLEVIDFGSAKHFIRLDPNLIDGQMTSATVTANNNVFNIEFVGMDMDPPTYVSADTVNLRAINVLRAPVGAVALKKFNYGSPYQVYTLLCATDGSAPQVIHNDAAGNIILKAGSNYAANSWKVLRFIYLPDGKFYEL